MGTLGRAVRTALWALAALAVAALGWEIVVSGRYPRWAAVAAAAALAAGVAWAVGRQRLTAARGERDEGHKLLHDASMERVASLAHQLSNTLTGVVGYGRLLEAMPESPGLVGDVGRLCAQAERAADLVRDLLAVARGGHTARGPARQTTDINALVKEVLDLRARQLLASGVDVRVELAPDLPPLAVDRREIQHALLNLVLNAKQAIAGTERPGILRVTTARRRGRIEVRVADNGGGIAEENLARIFELFFTTKGPADGAGLGLWLADRTVREHGGEILVETELGSGAAFTIVLPLPSAAEEPEPRPAKIQPTTRGISG